MRESLEEFLVVFAYSTRTQVALLFGVAFFVITMALGAFFTSRIEIHGVLAPLANVIRELIADRYDKVAWAALFGFLVLACKCHKKDQKRLVGF